MVTMTTHIKKREGAQGEFLWHQANHAARGSELGHDIMTVDHRGAGTGVDNPADDRDQRGFTSAIGTEQGQDFTGRYLQIHILEGVVTTGVGLGQVRYRNDGSHTKF